MMPSTRKMIRTECNFRSILLKVNRVSQKILFALTVGVLGSGITFSSALAQTTVVEKKIESIFLQTIRADGVLTKEKHEAFWRELNKLSAADREDLLKILRFGIVHAYRLQMAIFDSARISYLERKVVKTAELLRLEAETKSQYLSSLPSNIKKSDKDQAVREFEQGMAQAGQGQRRVLEAAANRVSLKVNEHETIEMTLENIESITSSIRLSIKRATLLMQPKWDEGAAQYQLQMPEKALSE